MSKLKLTATVHHQWVKYNTLCHNIAKAWSELSFNRSDPFCYAQLLSHFKSGIADVFDYEKLLARHKPAAKNKIMNDPLIEALIK